MRKLRLRLQWLTGRLKGALTRSLPVNLGGHSMPWWRWRTYREFYAERGSRDAKVRSRELTGDE